ncbi:MAG: hypothetical protein IJY08_02755 [Clostridia bacterium]|nr:hypothetical protein [Clostridia bacterium]
MNKNQFVSQNEAKYKNGRISLLCIIIFSAINVLSIAFADVYFLFSAYIPQLVTSVGAILYADTGEMLFYIIAVIMSLLLIVPYLLCYIFSKKKVGWMIAALVIFGIDSLIFLPDFILWVFEDVSMILDMAVRVIALVTLILGVVAGLKAEKEPKVAPETGEGMAYTPAGGESLDSETADTAQMMRALTIKRKKKYTGCAIEFRCFENGKEICRLKNGKSQTVMVTAQAFEFGVMFANGLSSEKILVPAGTTEIAYTVEPKMGFSMAKIIITPVQR